MTVPAFTPPACFVVAGTVTAAFFSAQPFTGPDGTKHPAQAWASWSAGDWSEKLPGVSVLPLVDVNPATAGQVGTRNAMSAWTVSADHVTATYTVRDMTGAEYQSAFAGQIRQGYVALIEGRAKALDEIGTDAARIEAAHLRLSVLMGTN